MPGEFLLRVVSFLRVVGRASKLWDAGIPMDQNPVE